MIAAASARNLRTPNGSSGPGAVMSHRRDALVVQAGQPVFGVVGVLQLPVRAPAAVLAPELLLAVVRRRVQRLVPAELGDLAFDDRVVVVAGLVLRPRHEPPETDAH